VTVTSSPSALVFGARNLGRAVIELLISQGWSVAGVARSAQTLDTIRAAGAHAIRADVTVADSVRDALAKAASRHGGVDLVVNAASAYGGQRRGPFGGGPIAEAESEAFDSWAVAPGRSAFDSLPTPCSSWPARGRGRLPTSFRSPRWRSAGSPRRMCVGPQEPEPGWVCRVSSPDSPVRIR